MVKNFSTKKQIDSYLRALDKEKFFPDSFESDFVPEGYSPNLKKKTTYVPNLKRRKYFEDLKLGFCEICKNKFERKKDLVIDHDHATRKIRGVLCQNCNGALGKFKDNPELMLEAIKYLENSKDKEGLDYWTLKPL